MPVDERIVAGLAALGIEAGFEVVVADRADVVEETAAAALQRHLAKGGLKVRVVPASQSKSGKRFLLGRESNLEAIKATLACSSAFANSSRHSHGCSLVTRVPA